MATDASLVLFCGVPGSGKTTIARLVAKGLGGSAVHVQTDAVRAMVGEAAYTRRESRFVYRALTAVAGEALRAGYHAILDGTFLREDFREEAVGRLAGAYSTLLVVHVECDLETAYRRNLARREARVPKRSFLRLCSRFERPANALRIDSGTTSPELACEAVLLQLRGA